MGLKNTRSSSAPIVTEIIATRDSAKKDLWIKRKAKVDIFLCLIEIA
jgi:hypothetical protein